MRAVPLFNPRTGEPDGEIPAVSAGKVARLAADLRAAQPGWQSLGVERRTEALAAWGQTLEQQRQSIVDALIRDTGRIMLAERELQLVLGRLQHWCQRAPELTEEISAAGGDSRNMPQVRWHYHCCPYPLVGVISPWNFPMMLGMFDAIPALAAGCAVLLKPSEIASRFIEPLRASLRDFPELSQVLGIVSGDARTGAAVVRQADAICFTGSVAVGRKIALTAARRLIPAFLELGGKDPAVVLASAELHNAVRAVLRGAAIGTGQACQSLERIYVAREVYEEFLQLLTRAAQKVQLSYPDPGSGHLGPFISAAQADKVQAQLTDAVRGGATVHCGGEVQTLGGGRWCLPTVLSGVDHRMKLMREETFGPVLPVMPFDSVDEAVQLANDSIYGLSAAVFAGSAAEAVAVAGRIHAGAVSINDATLTTLVDDAEKDSFGSSGVGRSRMGDSGFLRLLRKQAVLIQQAPSVDIDSVREDAAAR